MKRKFTSDESVIQGILCSDERALSHLYHEYAAMVSHLVITNSGSKDDADDIFQDTIIVIYEKIKSGTFVLNCSLKTYIYSVSRNLWLYKLRQTARDSKLEESFMVAPVDDMDVDNFYEENNKHDKITAYIKHLGESCKKILLLFYYEKLSTKDIAVKLQLAGGDYVKTQKYRCLQKLKSLYLKK